MQGFLFKATPPPHLTPLELQIKLDAFLQPTYQVQFTHLLGLRGLPPLPPGNPNLLCGEGGGSMTIFWNYIF